MAKEISYKAGRNKRHDSLYKVTVMNTDELEPENVSDVVQEHIRWLEGVLDGQGISKSLSIHDLSEEDAKNTKPMVIAALNALDGLYGASMMLSHIDMNDKSARVYTSVISGVALAIKNMLIVQEALHETAILDLKRRSKTLTENNRSASDEKQRLVNLCRPKYKEIKAKRTRLTDWAIAGELRKWLIEEGEQPRGQKQISRWIKEF